jgi:hypothetical protein
MDSLNEIIEERKKNKLPKHSQLHSILVPKVLRIQNSLDERAVLIEKLNVINAQQQQ